MRGFASLGLLTFGEHLEGRCSDAMDEYFYLLSGGVASHTLEDEDMSVPSSGAEYILRELEEESELSSSESLQENDFPQNLGPTGSNSPALAAGSSPVFSLVFSPVFLLPDSSPYEYGSYFAPCDPPHSFLELLPGFLGGDPPEAHDSDGLWKRDGEE